MLPVEIIVVVAVVDKFLLPVLDLIHRWFEIPDLRGLQGRAERAEGGIDIICLLPDRAVYTPSMSLDRVPRRETASRPGGRGVPAQTCRSLQAGILRTGAGPVPPLPKNTAPNHLP